MLLMSPLLGAELLNLTLQLALTMLLFHPPLLPTPLLFQQRLVFQTIVATRLQLLPYPAG